MLFANFEFESPIELSGLGHRWDLHNFGELVSIEFMPQKGSMLLSWRVTDELPSANFHPKNPHKKCSLRFDQVESVAIRRTLEEASPSDAGTLIEAGFALPLETTPPPILEVGARAFTEDPSDPLLLRFYDGLEVEIVASLATLEAD